MGDWEDVFGSQTSLDDLEEMGFFDDFSEDEYIVKSDLNPYNEVNLSNKVLFKEILARIESQSYNYSARNGKRSRNMLKKSFNTSLFFDDANPSNIYVPLFNYFENTVSWYRTNIYNPIRLTKQYKFYGAYKDILDSDTICELFINGKIKNLVLSSGHRYSYNPALNIQIVDEVLYTKRIYLLIHIVIDNQNKYTIIPIEGALSVRGDNIFRTDPHGNNLDGNVLEDKKRYQIFSFDTLIGLRIEL